MVNSGRREDDMLDVISALKHNREQAKAALEFYSEAHLIPAEIADHLWQVLSGVVQFIEEANDDNLVSSGQPER